MLKLNAIIAAAVGMVWVGCQMSPGDSKTGTLSLSLSNSETATVAKALEAVGGGVEGIEHIMLSIKDVQVHKAGGEGWMSIATPSGKVDFLQLVQGLTKPLAVYPLAAGHYTQIRLILNEDNEITVNGQSYPLSIPSGTQTGVKLVHQFRIEANQETELCIAFDALKAISLANDGVSYTMKPTYKIIACETGETEDELVPIDPDIPSDNVVIPMEY
jgi:hypothetical protein